MPDSVESVWVLAITSKPAKGDEYGLAVKYDDNPSGVAVMKALEAGSAALRDYEQARGLPRGRDRFELTHVPVVEEDV